MAGARPGAGPRSAGFTLLELLVVLLLIGFVLSFAVINIGAHSSAEQLDQETQRLQSLLRLASDQAVMQARTHGVRMRADGYAFVARRPVGWQRLEEAPLQPRHLDPAVTLHPPAAAPDTDADAPTLWLFPDGQITPFQLELTAGAERRRLIGVQNGEIRIER